MRFLVILILLPVLALAQRGNEDWTSQIADIDFNENKIIYTLYDNLSVGFENLKPIVYPVTIMKVLLKRSEIPFDAEFIRKIITSQNDYLESWNLGEANNRDKYSFLESAALTIIWNAGKKDILNKGSIEILRALKNDLSIEIATDAGMVLRLYEFYNKENNR